MLFNASYVKYWILVKIENICEHLNIIFDSFGLADGRPEGQHFAASEKVRPPRVKLVTIWTREVCGVIQRSKVNPRRSLRFESRGRVEPGRAQHLLPTLDHEPEEVGLDFGGGQCHYIGLETALDESGAKK